jgi:hypothetical protein
VRAYERGMREGQITLAFQGYGAVDGLRHITWCWCVMPPRRREIMPSGGTSGWTQNTSCPPGWPPMIGIIRSISTTSTIAYS